MNDEQEGVLGKIVVVMDVFFLGIGEVIGGLQWEEWFDVLKVCMVDMNVYEEEFWWYFELCKFGGVFYVGFGLGFECMVQFIIGMGNICDVIVFLCMLGNVEFQRKIEINKIEGLQY